MTMKQPPPHVKLRRRVWGDSAASTALAAAVADDEFTAAGVDELHLHSSAGRQMFPSWALSNRNNSRTPSPAPFPTTISNDYHGGNNGQSLVTVRPTAKPRQQQELYQSKRSTTSSSSYGSAATTTSSSTAAAPVASGGNALFPPSRGGFSSTFSHSHQIALHASQLKRTHSPSTESVVANKKAAPPPKPKRYFMPLSLSETDVIIFSIIFSL